MAAHGAHGRGDLGASEALDAQPDQTPILVTSRSQVEAAPREAAGVSALARYSMLSKPQLLLRLSLLLAPDTRIPVAELAERIARAYGLSRRRDA